MSIVKIWNSTTWSTATLIKIWNGASWNIISNYSNWNGTTWVKTTLDTPLDSQVITVGEDSGYDEFFQWSYIGYSSEAIITSPFGSISDGTSNIYSGATINKLYADTINDVMYLEINGTLANSGWDYMYIGGQNLARSSASYTSSGGVTTWFWTGVTNVVTLWTYPTTTVKFI